MESSTTSNSSDAEAIRAAGYLRVSTEEQVKHGWNLNADRERIEATIAERGWTLVEMYDDGGRQGDDPERPAFNRMLADVDQFDVLLLRDLDRFSRKLAIYATATDALVDSDVTLYEFAGDEGTGIRKLDLSDDDDRTLADMKAVLAASEKRKIKKRVRQAKSARARAGLHPGGKRPYGYTLEPTGATGKNGKPITALVPHPTERQVVVRIFQMAEGTSQRKIAQILNEEGIPASKGGRWSQSQIARLLGSPLYLGKLRRKVGGQWEINEGKHDPIVDDPEFPDLWQRVNNCRAMPERRVGGRPLASSHLLTRGLLRCGWCGSGLIPVPAYIKSRHEKYICIGRRDHGPEFCRMPSIRRDVVDETLLGQLTSRYFDLDGARERIREGQASQLPLAKAAVAEAQRELAAAEARIRKVERGWQDDVINDADYQRQTDQLRDELAGAQHALTQAKDRVVKINAAGATTDAEEALLRHLADLKQLVLSTVDQARDIEGLRTVIRQLFASVELCPPERPFGHGAKGEHIASDAVTDEEGDPMIGSYRLLIRMRPEMVDADWRPIKAQLPEVPANTGEELTSPTCR